MRKRRPGEHTEPIRAEHEREFAKLSERTAQWARENGDTLRNATPRMPPGVTNRDADKWRPLVSIADIARGKWPDIARKVCQAFVGQGRPSVSNGLALITACVAIFDAQERDEFFTEDLLKELNGLPEQPWAGYGGSQLDGHALSRLLRPYEIEPDRMSISGVQRRGYRRSQFKEALAAWGEVESEAA